ncbi:hypothetical protein L7F22_025683 [Adiantum nelumboides]|nr:hypothetical protein [Adiantum nelumboides]
MESFRAERMLKGDLSKLWKPSLEAMSGSSRRTQRDCFEDYIKNFEILDATAENIPNRPFTGEEVDDVRRQLLEEFGTPLEIVSDNGPRFRKGLLTEVCEELHILHRHSTPYYPQSNGLVEKANGIIAGIIRKMVKNKTKLWDDFLDGALWAYRTTYKEATEFTPFHLVYGQEALQPIELNIPTMRLHGKAAQRKEEEWTDRLLTLAELEWKREAAYECYKRKATQVKDNLDKEVKDKGIKEGDLVLRYDNRLDNRFDAKFETRWQGPYIVKKAFNSSYY